MINEQAWVAQVRAGDFSAIPDPLTWEQTAHFSHLLHGYRVSLAMGWGDLRYWANERLALAELTGEWHGSALELWCCLFFEHRRYRHMDEGDPTGPELELLNLLCRALRSKLQALDNSERTLLLHFLAIGL